MKSDLQADLLRTKTLWGLKRLNIAYSISLVLGVLNFTAEVLTQPIWSNLPYKVLLVVVYGSFIALNKSINRNLNLVKYVSFIAGEILNVILIHFAYIQEPSCSLIWIQLASFVIIFYQGYLLMTVKSLILFSVKHTTEWTLAGIYFSKSPIDNYAPFISGACALPIFMFACLYFNYLQDIDLCHSKKLLEYSTNKIECLVECISDSVFVIDSNFKILFTNSASNLSLAGKSFKEHVSGLSYHIRYLEENDNPSLLEDIKKGFGDQMGAEGEFGVTLANGAYVEWSGRLVIWENQLAMIVIGKNVSRLIQLEKVSLESQYKSALLRTVSHELRTPTNALLTMTQLVQDSKNLSEKDQGRLGLIRSSCTYLLCLINDLLDYSQIMAGSLKISKIQFEMHELLEDCMKLIEVQLLGTNIKLCLNFLTAVPTLLVSDPYRIKQIVLNLLSNAKKFTVAGSISLNISFEAEKLTVSCEDTGVGISPEGMTKLFQQFSKLDLPDLNPQGVGLGLYISNMLTYELGGEGIKVKSVVGKGSVFTFTIQVGVAECVLATEDIPDENAKVYLPRTAICTMRSNREVLIVDDTQFNVLAYSQILESEGFRCYSAINGVEAIEAIKKKEFLFVFMDCEMPVLDGWETMERLKEMLKNKEIKKLPPVIACTAHSSEVVLYRCQQAGMSALIIKPCPREVILQKINEILQSPEVPNL